MAVAGKVCTGFSLPYVALYAYTGGAVVYSSGKKLARGVSVAMDITTSDDNKFYADNVQAEAVGGKFKEGTITLTVDGLLPDSEKLIQGVSTSSVTITVGGTTSTVTIYNYDNNQTVPYVGVGYVARYLSEGATTYVPCVVKKAKFETPKHDAATEADEEIEFQTQELTANLFRSDASDNGWFSYGADLATEAEAEAVVKNMLSIT